MNESTGLCPHFGECGGCQSQDIPYAEQVRAKSEMLQALFAPFWTEPIPVSPSPVVEHYRNKVDPSFAPKQYPEAPPPGFQRETVLGFKMKGRWFWPLDIETCRIGPAGLDGLLARVREWQRASGLRAFDSRTGEGVLRVLLVRDGKRTGQRMVALITRPGAFDGGDFVRAVRESFHADSIYRGEFSGTADVAAAERLELLWGKEYIFDELEIAGRRLRFRISPFSFFQTNPLATEILYGTIRDWVARCAPEHLYDLYGGMGGIAFSCADLVRQVWSVESVAEASADGRQNALDNGIENVTFITAIVKNYLKELLRGEGLAADSAVVLDPPRSGLHPKALRRIAELGPRHLLYVACNPKNLAHEMPALLEAFSLRALHAVDLFPHTRHVEVVAEFERTTI